MSYHHLGDVLRNEVPDGNVTLIVQINDITDDNKHAVIVQDGYHSIIHLLDDAPRITKGTTMILRMVVVSHVPAAGSSPKHVSMFLHSNSVVEPTTCEVSALPLGDLGGFDDAPSTQPTRVQRRALTGTKACEWCQDPSTPFCSGTGKRHDICPDCSASKKASPFCPQTGQHH